MTFLIVKRGGPTFQNGKVKHGAAEFGALYGVAFCGKLTG